MKTNYISIQTAAARSGFSQCQIHALIINNKIEHKMVRRQIMIPEDALIIFAEQNPIITEVMRERSSGNLAFYHFLGVVADEDGGVHKTQ